MEILIVFFSLLGVIGIILITYFGIKWVTKRIRFNADGSVNIIETISLGPDKSLAIVNIGEKYMLIGISQQHIEKICDLDKSDIKEKPTAMTQSKMNFKDALKTVLKEKTTFKGGDGSDIK